MKTNEKAMEAERCLPMMFWISLHFSWIVLENCIFYTALFAKGVAETFYPDHLYGHASMMGGCQKASTKGCAEALAKAFTLPWEPVGTARQSEPSKKPNEIY